MMILNQTDVVILAAATLLWVIPEVILTRLRRPAAGARVSDRVSGQLIFLCNTLACWGAWVAALMAPSLAMHGSRALIFASGIVLMLGGMAFRWYSIRVLGRYFTAVVAVQQGQAIVQSGPYRFIRHPAYTGALLTVLGYGLAFANWLSLLCALTLPLIGYAYRIGVEEQVLVTALGDEYRRYQQRTRRIIPFVL